MVAVQYIKIVLTIIKYIPYISVTTAVAILSRDTSTLVFFLASFSQWKPITNMASKDAMTEMAGN